jgi:ArsR family transcriptional regulator, arsenate/arsenite/antimonite-responsive transcriptional repressor
VDADEEELGLFASIDSHRYDSRVRELPLVECCSPLAVSTLSGDDAVELERLFKALGDRHRLRILNVLMQAREEVCVCEFQPTLGISQPTVSHHLKQLVEAGILEREKRGTYAYYRLKPGVLDRVGDLLAEPGRAELAAVPA